MKDIKFTIFYLNNYNLTESQKKMNKFFFLIIIFFKFMELDQLQVDVYKIN